MDLFDPRCYELADFILTQKDRPDLTPIQREERRFDLACAIQDAIDEWIDYEPPVEPRQEHDNQ